MSSQDGAHSLPHPPTDPLNHSHRTLLTHAHTRSRQVATDGETMTHCRFEWRESAECSKGRQTKAATNHGPHVLRCTGHGGLVAGHTSGDTNATVGRRRETRRIETGADAKAADHGQLADDNTHASSIATTTGCWHWMDRMCDVMLAGLLTISANERSETNGTEAKDELKRLVRRTVAGLLGTRANTAVGASQWTDWQSASMVVGVCGCWSTMRMYERGAGSICGSVAIVAICHAK